MKRKLLTRLLVIGMAIISTIGFTACSSKKNDEPVVAKNVTYTAKYNSEATTAYTGLQSGIISELNQRGAEVCQENSLTLMTDGTYELVKKLTTSGKKDDQMKINIVYSFQGNYILDGNLVTLKAPISATSNTDWGVVGSYLPNQSGFISSDDDPNILCYFNTGFLRKSDENTETTVTVDHETLEVTFEEVSIEKEIVEGPYTYTETEVSCVNDGMKIYGVTLVPDGIEGKIPTVILSHGYNANYQTMIRIARYLASQGIACYTFDYCGGSTHTKSDGDMSEMSIITEKKDLIAVIDFVKALDYVDANHLFVVGESQGGCVAALTAAEKAEDIKGLVLLYPALMIPIGAQEKYASVDDIPDTIEVLGGTIGKRYYADILDIDIYKDIASYSKDVLIFHGDSDYLVDLSVSERALEAYHSAELVVMKGEGHGFTEEGQLEVAKHTLAFINNHLD